MAVFDYSGATIYSIEEYKAKQQARVQHVKSLKSGPWVGKRKREVGTLYHNDSVTQIKGLRETGTQSCRVAKLKSLGCTTVGDILKKADEARIHLTEGMRKHFDTAMQGSWAPGTDHTRASNPYLSRYGIGYPFIYCEHCIVQFHNY